MSAQQIPLTQEMEQYKKPNESIEVYKPSLIEVAVQRGAGIEELRALMQLEREYKQDRAREAFVSAMNRFKASPPQIEKNKEVKFGQTQYKHATLDHVCDVVTKSLSQQGISHRWKVEQDKEWITVVCILTHELGHSEETKLVGCADNSGSKNSIQAIGSTVTYLQRYTLLAATGLAASNSDDDGGSPKMENLQEQLDWIANCSTVEELKRIYDSAYDKAKKAKDQNAMREIVKAKDKRKAELS